MNLQKQIADLSAQVCAVQSVFTDRRAYVNALTYEIETATASLPSKAFKNDLDKYKAEAATVEYPDGQQEVVQLRSAGRDIQRPQGPARQAERGTGRHSQAGHEAKTAMDDYINDHMVDLTPTQIAGLEKKTDDLDPKIMQINVAEANIVDRCESCHMGIREPVKLTAASMSPKGAKSPTTTPKRSSATRTRNLLQDSRS